MLGDLATNVLVTLFGYAYPAFECFKALELRQRPGEVEQLRFWCQYWVIVAIITSIEKFGDPLVSWLPMYGEAKLAFFVYLWYPKTKGSDLIYDTFLRPLVMQYEPDIEQRLKNLRARSGELLLFYLKNFTDKGTTLFLEVLNYVVSGGSRASGTLQENRQSGSSSRWNPISALRSFRQPPTAKVGADSKLTAEELEVEDALANYLRASRAQQGQQAQHRRPRHHQ